MLLNSLDGLFCNLLYPRGCIGRDGFVRAQDNNTYIRNADQDCLDVIPVSSDVHPASFRRSLAL